MAEAASDPWKPGRLTTGGRSGFAEQQNLRICVPLMVAVMFLPPGFLSGLRGINVAGIPGADNAHAFWIFGGVLVVIVVARLPYFRLRRWY